MPRLIIDGVELKEFDTYTPVRNTITKGGRNELTGKNKLKIVARKWKITVGAAYISDAEYKKITDVIDKNELNLNVQFTDKGEEMQEAKCYAVYTKDRSLDADAIGCWSNFSLELIEN